INNLGINLGHNFGRPFWRERSMRRFSVMAGGLFALLLSTFIFAQTAQPLQNPSTPQRLRGAHRKGGRRGEKWFQRMDTNNDGVISRDEWKGRPKGFESLDKNKDGSISREEAALAGARQGVHWFKQMDTNNDKQISRDEWKGSAETFNRFDIN